MNFEYLEKGNSKIAERLLKSLPEWFGLEDSTQAYIKESKELPMLIAYKEELPIGFISIKKHSPFTSELYVMGIHPDFHRMSYGSKMIAQLEKKLVDQGIEFLQVKTLSEEHECKFYKATRLFYKSQGFKEVEVFPSLWETGNPCLLLIKGLS